MTRSNPTNPYTQDKNHTSKDVQMPIAKARVQNVTGMPDGDGFHTARIRVYGDGSSYVAPVLTLVEGMVSVPKEGDDVAVLFTQHDKPWIIGSWYALDRVESGETYLPDYDVGDLRFGNDTGSHVTIQQDGIITISTTGTQPVNVDTQSAAVYMDTDQTITDNDTYQKVLWDSVENNDEDIFHESTSSFVLLNDGKYNISTTLMFPNAGQNNRYNVGLFVNGTEIKRKSRQSSVNAEMSLDASITTQLEKGDEIDVRVRQDSGSDKILDGSQITNDFIINREGI